MAQGKRKVRGRPVEYPLPERIAEVVLRAKPKEGLAVHGRRQSDK